MANWQDPRTTTGWNPRRSDGWRSERHPRCGPSVVHAQSLQLYGLGRLLTGIVALLFASSGYAAQVMATPLKWVIVLSPLAIVFAMSFGVNRMKETTLQALFWTFAVLMGLSMSTIFPVFTGTSIAQTFFAVTASFLALSLWGYTTKKDLSGCGHVPDHGRGRPAGRDADQHLPAVDRDDARDQRHRRSAVRRPSRPTTRRRPKACMPMSPARDMMGKVVIMGGADALSRLHQHVPVPAQLHGQPRIGFCWDGKARWAGGAILRPFFSERQRRILMKTNFLIPLAALLLLTGCRRRSAGL